MRLSSILSDGMVLQRKASVTIWGNTSSLQTVTISFLGKQYETKSDAQGKWKIVFADLEPGGPYQMEITGDEKKMIHDILIGDVWLLGGQSNMELPVGRTLDLFEEEIKQVNEPYIRQFAVPQEYNFKAPQEQLSDAKWIAADPEHLLQFSGAGFYFAQEMYAKYGVPIGLIMSAVGGTPIEAWMSEDTLRKIGTYDETLDKCKDDVYITSTIRNEEQAANEWYEHLNANDKGLKETPWYSKSIDVSDWQDFELPKSWEATDLENVRGAVWFRKEIDVPESMINTEARLKLGTIVDADDTYVNGVRIGNTAYRYPPRRYKIPKGLLKPGKNVITVRVITTGNTGEFIKDMPYKLIANEQELDLKGTWKYKIGEVTEAQPTTTFFRNMPAGLYNGMISPLKNFTIKGVLWYQGESNSGQPEGYRELFHDLVNDWRNNWNMGEFPFIFTQLTNFEADPKNPKATNWAELREEQRMSLAIPNTAMAVTIDIGEYNELHPQDKKTLGKRLALCARKLAFNEDVAFSGPLYTKMVRVGSAIQLHFDQVGEGLASKDGELHHFEICGSNGQYMDAKATIKGDTIIVSNEDIKEAHHVRYAWLNNPENANLYNKEGLPASPFNTES
ncbi:sialate O-acetylesterase [Aquibacillus koreensis]|uniref:Sialate O-acetylesterase n=1 Tax=Aquibacillus koreensis TaxID=279446 RepID=A0A9X3WJT5_9BACI|nr:sialate O-acetylesterase [Aquibacillus koreensis]MCT2535151.1 sialate O-acetylesterase [Aquibacillus koreensis]MDC3421010.1 sialate O-acetylesterase [Aquibacillus koreensis]